MKRFATALTIALAVGFGGLTISPVTASSASVVAPAIEEDELGWDCRTMGNKICGDL